MRKLDKTILTEDEGYLSKACDEVRRVIERALRNANFYNERYVIRVTVDLVDDRESRDDEDES